MRGARVAQQVVLRGFPWVELSLGYVWIHMLPVDNRWSVRRRVAEMSDPRARHFHDPRRRAGRALAASLGAPGKILWDAYLLYPQGAVWDATPPAPADWAHQLDADWAERARHHTGKDLELELQRIMSELTKAPQYGQGCGR